MRDRLDAKRYGRRQLSGAASCDGDIDGCGPACERNIGGHLANGAQGRATATQSNRAGEARGWSEWKLILRGLAGRNGDSGRAAGDRSDRKCSEGCGANGRGLGRASSVTVSIAALSPAATGLKTRDAVQLAAGASEPEQLLVRLNCDTRSTERNGRDLQRCIPGIDDGNGLRCPGSALCRSRKRWRGR